MPEKKLEDNLAFDLAECIMEDEYGVEVELEFIF